MILVYLNYPIKIFFPISVKDNSTNYSILNNKDEITNYELSKSSIPLENKKPKKNCFNG